MNRHAFGQITIDGWAQHWMRSRRIRLARLHNRNRERVAYHAAMDRLFLQAEQVNEDAHAIIYKNSKPENNINL